MHTNKGNNIQSDGLTFHVRTQSTVFVTQCSINDFNDCKRTIFQLFQLCQRQLGVTKLGVCRPCVVLHVGDNGFIVVLAYLKKSDDSV